MEKIKNFFSKHGLIAFIVLFLIMSMRGCVKNGKIAKLEKQIDTLKTQSIGLQESKQNEEKAKLAGKLEAYKNINNKMSVLNRTEQMMDFQKKEIIPEMEKTEQDLNAKRK